MTHEGQPHWSVRVLRIAAGLLAAVAALVWLTPVSAIGTNLVPFGCGSPAAPAEGQLASYVCKKDLDGARLTSLAFLVSAAIVLCVGEVLLPRVRTRPRLLGMALAAPVAVPLFVTSVFNAFAVVGTVAADGTLIRCGTAFSPATDSISVGLCGHLPDEQRVLSIGGAALGLALIAGAAYVGQWWAGAVPKPEAVAEGKNGGEGVDATPH